MCACVSTSFAPTIFSFSRALFLRVPSSSLPLSPSLSLLATADGALLSSLRSLCVSRSGNVVIQTQFFNGDELISTSKVRIFYV